MGISGPNIPVAPSALEVLVNWDAGGGTRAGVGRASIDVLGVALDPHINGTVNTFAKRLPIYAVDFGEICDGSHDNLDAYTAAIAAGVAQGRGVMFGAGLSFVSAPVPINGYLPEMSGQGEGVTIIVGSHNGPLFQWTVNTTEVARFRVHDLTLRGQFGGAAPHGQSVGFKIVGDATAWFQLGTFDHITTEGLDYGLLHMAKGAFDDGVFGYESRCGFLTFDTITCRAGSIPGKYCFYFENGSGTGHVFTNIKPAITGSGTAVLRVESHPGGNAVAGDIVMTGCHFAGVAAVISLGAGTTYRQNIRINGSQIDAGALTAFDLPSDSLTAAGIGLTGNNLGGGTSLALPVIAQSTIHDQQTSDWRAGTVKTTDATGAAQTIPMFSVKLGPYTGSRVTFVISGLIGGVGGGVASGEYLIRRLDGGAVALQISDFKSPDGMWSMSVAGAGDTITLSAVCTPAGGGTRVEGQIACMGGALSVKRL